MTDEQVLWQDTGYKVSIVYPSPSEVTGKKGAYSILRYDIRIPTKKLRGVT